METKICTVCELNQPISEFILVKVDEDKRRSACKSCLAIKNKLYREKSIEKFRLIAKENYHKNIDRITEYRIENKDKINERSRKYRENNIENEKGRANLYYQNNKDKKKIYSEINKEQIKKRQSLYNKTNRDTINKKRKEWRKINKDKINKRGNEYYNNRMISDPLFKLKKNTQLLIRDSFRRKELSKGNKRTVDILGCTIEQFKQYLESKFESWMTWDNKSLYNGELNFGWDIDHIVAISTATCEIDIIRLNHYTNLQPLCSYINRVIKRGN